MGATRVKTEFLTKIRLERFLSVNLPNCWLVTMTFHENIVEKKEAMQRWKPVADYLKRHEIDWCGVWQQQKRGAWHHHFLINKYINVVPFREFIIARGWGQFVNIEAVGQEHGGRKFQDPNRLVKYLTRYLTRSLCEHVPNRVRLTSGRASNKVGTTRFQWVKGLGRAWRAGCQSYYDEEFRMINKHGREYIVHRDPMKVAWSHRDHIMRRGFAALGLGDWDAYMRERALARGRELARGSG